MPLQSRHTVLYGDSIITEVQECRNVLGVKDIVAINVPTLAGGWVFLTPTQLASFIDDLQHKLSLLRPE